MSAGSGLSKRSRLAGRRMDKAEQPRMQGLARKCRDFRADRPEAGDRAARRACRKPDRRSPDGRYARDARGSGACGRSTAGIRAARPHPTSATETPLDAIAGHRRLAARLGDDRHFLAVDRAAADIAGDLAGSGQRHAPDHSAVGALDAARGEILAPGRDAPLRSSRQPGGRSCPCRGDARCPAA